MLERRPAQRELVDCGHSTLSISACARPERATTERGKRARTNSHSQPDNMHIHLPRQPFQRSPEDRQQRKREEEIPVYAVLRYVFLLCLCQFSGSEKR